MVQSSKVYEEKVAQFDVPLLSFKILTNGVKLGTNHRKETVKIVSTSDFDEKNIEIKFNNGMFDHSRVKYAINRKDHNSNDYDLTVLVSEDIVEDFSATIRLVAPQTGDVTELPLSFSKAEINVR